MDKCEKVPRLERFRSEEEFTKTWDRCVTDMIVKMGGGLGLGIVFSLFLFGRRGWPIYFGMGSGFGVAYNNCQNAFSGPLRSQPRPRCSGEVRRRCERMKEVNAKKDSSGGLLVCVKEPSPDVCKREEPCFGQVSSSDRFNPSRPHFNMVGQLPQREEQPQDPRDTCRFKNRM